MNWILVYMFPHPFQIGPFDSETAAWRAWEKFAVLRLGPYDGVCVSSEGHVTEPGPRSESAIKKIKKDRASKPKTPFKPFK